MVPALVLLDAAARVAALVRPRLAVDGVAGEDHDLSLVDPRGEDVIHVEVFKIEESAGLARDEQDGLARMAVDLEFHIPCEVPRILFKIADFHCAYLLLSSES